MNTQDTRAHAIEQDLAEGATLAKKMDEETKDFVEKGAESYAKE